MLDGILSLPTLTALTLSQVTSEMLAYSLEIGFMVVTGAVGVQAGINSSSTGIVFYAAIKNSALVVFNFFTERIIFSST